MSGPPKIDNAPGLTWRRLKHGWEARWRARTDLIGNANTVKNSNCVKRDDNCPHSRSTTAPLRRCEDGFPGWHDDGQRIACRSSGRAT